jgi:2-dehydropantoate 2-reductase
VRFLVVGAGAIGGYFGGRLLEAGRDVTFLVRPGRAAQLAATGLVIRSRYGDATLPSPPRVLADELSQTFDVVLLSCKAYDLEQAMASFAPAVGASTAIVPLLNGLNHLDSLAERFGAKPVLGGQCFVSASLDPTGAVLHLNENHALSFGERDGTMSGRVRAITAAMAGARFDLRASDQILLEMWEKWVFIASLAGITCLMRATVGDIVAAGGADLALGLLAECAAVAEAAGCAPRSESMERTRGLLSAAGSPLAASMLRDVERGAPTEAAHILGDLLRRRGPASGPDRSLLRLAFTHLSAYEARRLREAV